MRFSSPDRKPFGASKARGSDEAENGEPQKIKGTIRGERNLSFLTLCQIARTLGCDVAALTVDLPRKARGRKS